ncbi:MAG: NADH-quinone oxidoreductase subunit L [Planctomycetales bacterium]|nr:NADH-quinone oxidoreductase subunit L [Planctomycetales bacterium]
MDANTIIPILLGAAWLLPLASFVTIVLAGPRMGKAGSAAAGVATSAILIGFVLSATSLMIWLVANPLPEPHHPGGHHEAEHHDAEHDIPAGEHATGNGSTPFHAVAFLADDSADPSDDAHADADGAEAGHQNDAGDHAAAEAYTAPTPIVGTWYSLGEFGSLRIDIGYYIDTLTVVMFTMVTLIASCIHFYAIGYMHDELHDYTDPLAPTADGQPLHRPGRFHRFFQYLSLFCFSMLGLVYAGNIAMVFVFWELVGICSYFLIGFYFERHSASTAANKAFIVNRVGDFGFIIGLMALWASLGTFAFGDQVVDGQTQPGIFSLVRPADHSHKLIVPAGMVTAAAADEINEAVLSAPPTEAAASAQPSAAAIDQWRSEGYGYWLLVIAGLGVFCGCVGKSAQFPLHVWLPDAMEGPTPVSALVHSATMVAAGVYLVGRFYPVFTPEVLLVITYVGAVTLFIAATIAITATDIKRVLAYSTVSQLGYMMLALGVGGWVAGMFHLVTHAFFKSLLFMCSGSVIHACHTNEMTEMGGLRKKMPWTAYTMLVGCLAIIGAAIPFVVGFSGYYSKDSIVAQSLLFWQANPSHPWPFYAAAGGAAITAFYMFRLWFMTFAGEPRNHHVYEHAHESPKVMYMPLVVLAVFATIVAWPVPLTNLSLNNMLEQARPTGMLPGDGEVWSGVLMDNLVIPNELLSHELDIHVPATLIASGTAMLGLLLAVAFYGVGALDPNEVRQRFKLIYWWLWNKWMFDELYDAVFVRPVHFVSRTIANIDRTLIDGLINNLALGVRRIADIDGLIDKYVVDGLVNRTASCIYSSGLAPRRVQNGRLQTYVVWIVAGTAAIFVLSEYLGWLSWGLGITTAFK